MCAIRNFATMSKNHEFKYESLRDDLLGIFGRTKRSEQFTKGFSTLHVNDIIDNTYRRLMMWDELGGLNEDLELSVVKSMIQSYIDIVNKSFDSNEHNDEFLQYLQGEFEVDKLRLTPSRKTQSEVHHALRYAIELTLDRYNVGPISRGRKILFPPHLKQAGISALSYFNRILESKYPDEEIEVSIQQSPNSDTVTLIISTPDGEHLESIERTLTTYAQVITGNEKIEALTDDKLVQVQLQNQIQLLTFQIDSEKRLNDLLSGEVESYKAMLGEAIQGKNKADDLLSKVITAHTRESGKMLKALDRLIEAGLNGELNQEKFNTKVQEIKENDPSLFKHMGDIAKSAMGGALGRHLYEFSIAFQTFSPIQ